MMESIKALDAEKCTGCGGCMAVCVTKCISMTEDEEGFLRPNVMQDKCIECGRCMSFCTRKEVYSDFKSKAYAACSKDEIIKQKSSSGGIFYHLAKEFIEAGGIVYGAAFVSPNEVKHIRIDKVKDIDILMGSKYVQSNVSECWEEITNDLLAGKEVLFSGTPCQVESLKKIFRDYEDKVYGIAVVCHGVPSPLVWKKYISLKMGQYDESKIRNISFRDKTFGWNRFSLKIDFDNNEYIDGHEHDIYMQGFLRNLYLRKSCYECNCKGVGGYNDIILGDFWNVEMEIPGIDTYLGISAVIINSKKGKMLWESVIDNLEYRSVSIEQIARNNTALEMSVQKNPDRSIFYQELLNGGIIDEVITSILRKDLIDDDIRRKYYYPILLEYLESYVDGFSLGKILEDNGLCRIVLYGVTDILRIAKMDIEKNNRVDITICDKNPSSFIDEFANSRVCGLEDLVILCNNHEVDAIIICNLLREGQIRNDFEKRNISSKVYSFVQLLPQRKSV
ncbi:Coenzyme F420-reducing hydrogenase, beta subunit [Pseudobutyrivibrio sp. UC1225]|uniref:Coenzyme F420 hydrogenase/dehydrogenase, beta subunit C-terminal domain n=1 Tax=Pseudobutyrivibrio sp. UC1225 TaxID=1798185 RepID=UPI0008ED5D8D|nr:Coenzyme F420 hydrogenase/dehydrogenase, beta subunit C-terminal domain [Pseudobutyrivibrio sp. UC1225]SFO06981.1 Coenzyme F420-reducing hydrogenase, beta subunit [Pseudobutyrivibrio sp. UC1225]